MPTPPFPQTRESDLLDWSTAFSAAITASPATYGLTALQAAFYESPLHADFAAALAVAQNPNTNSKGNTEIKNAAKQALLYGPGGAWQLVNIAQAFPGMTDTLRIALNIRIPDATPTPAPIPTQAPDIDIISTFGHTIKVRVHESGVPANPKPAGVKGVTLFAFVGEVPPADVRTWLFVGATGKSTHDVVLPVETPAGSMVWISGFWYNNRMQSGPSATPVTIHVPGSMSQAA